MGFISENKKKNKEIQLFVLCTIIMINSICFNLWFGNLQTVFHVHFTFIAVSSAVGATDWEVDKGANQAAVGVHGRGI